MPNPTVEAPEMLREFAPHALPIDEVAKRLETSPEGLSASRRRADAYTSLVRTR
jgi:hypothetical protein